MNHNRALADRWIANAEAYGIVDQGMDPASGSTDMANVSWVVPAIHPELSITDQPTPGHTIEFRDAAGEAARRRDDAARGDARRADGARPPRGPGARRGRVDRVQGDRARRLTGYDAPGAPRWTADPNRRRAD